MCGSYFASVPRGCKTHHESIQVCVTLRNNTLRRSNGESGEVRLHGSDLVQKAQWVEHASSVTKVVLGCFGNRVSLEHAGGRRLRRVVALLHARADTDLLGKLERRLEEVDEQTRRCVEPS
jgi:hypothetical protein